MKLIIVGAGASGKDHLKRRLQETKGYTTSVSYTSRKPRATEREGVDYHFISEDKFLTDIALDKFLEWNKFGNGAYYGTGRAEFDRAELFIMTPSGIRSLSPEQRRESIVVYLDIPYEVRRERLIVRSDINDDPERRLRTDAADFDGFSDYDIKITNPDF